MNLRRIVIISFSFSARDKKQWKRNDGVLVYRLSRMADSVC